MTTVGLWRELRQDNRNVLLTGFGQLSRVHYVFPDGGGPRGAYATMTECFENIRSRDTIVLGGVLREQAVAPLGAFDVTIIGAANRPRQATNSGIPTGGGASWLAPTSPAATTPLLELREQGWTIEGIQFAAHTDDACIKMHCEETATYPDASHLTLRNCRFTGGLIGLEDYGGASNVLVEDCSFEGLDGVGGGAIVCTNQSIRIPQRWMVRNNRFLPCVNGILSAHVDSQFRFNSFAAMTTATINLAFGNTGLRNMLFLNQFSVDDAGFDPAGGYTGNATDIWYSVLSDAVDFGVPA